MTLLFFTICVNTENVIKYRMVIGRGSRGSAYPLVMAYYCGYVINFKTYLKSFNNKVRIPNLEENRAVFKNVHEPIVDRETFEAVQKLISKTERSESLSITAL